MPGNDQQYGGIGEVARVPVASIGASAGGIAALQSFFDALPAKVGAAFVVIVHLDPEHASELSRIIATRAKMPVVEVAEDQPIEADKVYVIPPNRQLLVSAARISSAPFNEPRGQRAPIDQFRSVAEQHGDGFAIILTGAGSDGAVGVKAVKEAGGIILVQDPNEAEYPSMPRSAIASGVADFVLPVREIAQRIPELVRNKEQFTGEGLAEKNEESLRRILAYLRLKSGHDFSQYKRSTIVRRLARRMQVTRAETLDDYLAQLRKEAEEAQALLGDLLISVTSFFRDPAAFEQLGREVVPRLFEERDPNNSLRVWVPGCATDEEVYSIAMLLIEESARREDRPDIQVLLPIWMPERSRPHGKEAIRWPSEPMSRKTACASSSRARAITIAYAARCAISSCSFPTVCCETHRSRTSTSSLAATCSSILTARCRTRSAARSTTLCDGMGTFSSALRRRSTASCSVR